MDSREISNLIRWQLAITLPLPNFVNKKRRGPRHRCLRMGRDGPRKGDRHLKTRNRISIEFFSRNFVHISWQRFVRCSYAALSNVMNTDETTEGTYVVEASGSIWRWAVWCNIICYQIQRRAVCDWVYTQIWFFVHTFTTAENVEREVVSIQSLVSFIFRIP